MLHEDFETEMPIDATFSGVVRYGTGTIHKGGIVMNKLFTGILAASLALSAPLMAQQDEEYDYDRETVEWEVKLLGPDGNEVERASRASDFVATVLGPRKYRLSVGCSRVDGRRFVRIERLVDKEANEDFAGRVLDPLVEVRYGGDTIFTTGRGVLRLQDDEGWYEGRASDALANALQRGNRAIFYDQDSDLRIAFHLDGSYRAISMIPCD